MKVFNPAVLVCVLVWAVNANATPDVRGYVGHPAFGRSEVWLRKSLFREQIEAMLAAGAE